MTTAAPAAASPLGRRAWLAALLVAALLGTGLLVVRLAAPTLAAVGRSPATDQPLSGSSVYQLDSRWTTERGQPLRLAELRGRPRVVSMIFTHCPSACPTLVKEMQALEQRLPTAVRERAGFVLVSIDPDRDSPEVLRAYAGKMGLALDRWTLLRGDAEAVRELSATLGFSYGKGEGADIAHSKLITILNADGEIVHQQLGVANDPERLVAAVTTAVGPD